MRKCSLLLAILFASLFSNAANKDSVTLYTLPDSIKAISFLTDIQAGSIITKKEFRAGIKDGTVSLYIEKSKKEIEFVFEFPSTASVVVTGFDIESEKEELTWLYNATSNETYKLMLATASDSAENFMLYSGYVFLPKESKWKLIGTCKISNQWGTIKNPATYFSILKKDPPLVNFSSIWCQRNNGSWKNMTGSSAETPTINLYSHIDSTQQLLNETKILEDAINTAKTETKQNKNGVYYTILKEGTGRQVQLTDTVVAYYKGYLFNDGRIFDQTKEKPATFALKRLIRGWQIGVPFCKVGGKIKLVIPSGLAYSIRTRAAKIPPNSILVFEIEIIEVREGT